MDGFARERRRKGETRTGSSNPRRSGKVGDVALGQDSGKSKSRFITCSDGGWLKQKRDQKQEQRALLFFPTMLLWMAYAGSSCAASRGGSGCLVVKQAKAEGSAKARTSYFLVHERGEAATRVCMQRRD